MNEEQKTEIFQVGQNAEEKSGISRKSNGKKWGIISGVALILIALIIGINIYNFPANRLSRQLDLGNRYLEEQNYEQAVVEFDKAIEIDPMSVEAYLGLADAYIGKDDYESALIVLQKGYDLTGNEEIGNKLDGIKEEIERREYAEESKKVLTYIEHKMEGRSDEVKEIIEVCKEMGEISAVYEGHFLSYEQLEINYRPFIEQLETYLAVNPNDQEAWEILAWLYLRLGQMQLCLETRQKGYEFTKYEHLLPEVYTEESSSVAGYSIVVFDEYGRKIESESELQNYLYSSYTYGEGDRLLTSEYNEDNRWFMDREFVYDDLGRMIECRGNDYADDYADTCVWKLEYEDDGSILVTSHSYIYSHDDWDKRKIIIDEYGKVLSKEIIDSWAKY